MTSLKCEMNSNIMTPLTTNSLQFDYKQRSEDCTAFHRCSGSEGTGLKHNAASCPPTNRHMTTNAEYRLTNTGKTMVQWQWQVV